MATSTPASAPDKNGKASAVINQTFKDIEKLETDLWEAADNLRANSKLTSSDYFMPVLGVIFLRHAANRFEAAQKQIEADQVSGKMPKRKLVAADYHRRRALWLPENARYDWIMENATISGKSLPTLVTEAMEAIEASFEPLKNVLPKDYGIFDEPKVLEDLMRLFNSEQIKQATGDVFGRIYEYFLAKFSIQKAHDNGEFFTPSSLVQMIVNVIEPDHGTVFDPACGSGGMFVQSSHFIEQEGGDTSTKVTFYGQEKNPDTIRIAKMNLAVHGLEGKIANAITYYQDEHNLGPKEALKPGQCDFVMANPPFNVDLVDAAKVTGDPRLPFGLPGVSKGNGKPNADGDSKKRKGTVSNGNYLWISYFWSYLNDAGRAGFVMSAQASSAGHAEKLVRKKLIETGDVDVMISIRSNFFYTRTVPCELWHFDKGKPPARKKKVLMIDARNVFRKVTRTIYDFSPEQMLNITAIVWLYRGEQDRFLALVREYFQRLREEALMVAQVLSLFEGALKDSSVFLDRGEVLIRTLDELDEQSKQQVEASSAALRDEITALTSDCSHLNAAIKSFVGAKANATLMSNEAQRRAHQSFATIVDSIRNLIKRIDLVYKLVSKLADWLAETTAGLDANVRIDRRSVGKIVKNLNEARERAVEQLNNVIYFDRQIAWLQERFPNAEMTSVPGLAKVVDLEELEEKDWSLTPGRYVGVAPIEEAEGFDFEQAMREIHTEFANLSGEAAKLTKEVLRRFREIGA